MAERFFEPDDPILREFVALPLNETLELPLDVLTPPEADDGLSSHTAGPIDVYALRNVSERSRHVGMVALWIADGNHRYYAMRREGGLTIMTRKIVPAEENDIRYRFDAHNAWENYP